MDSNRSARQTSGGNRRPPGAEQQQVLRKRSTRCRPSCRYVLFDLSPARIFSQFKRVCLLAFCILPGQILASLLVGPCALDYSKMKTQDHIWTDPPADELVQRHRLSSPLLNGQSTPPASRKPLGLTYKRGVTPGMDIVIAGRSSNSSEESTPRNSAPWSPRDYVESLHQNCKNTLLYGKNNVVVQPVSVHFKSFRF